MMIQPTTYYLLLYRTVNNYVQLRAPYREAHLQMATEAAQKGQLLMAGAFADPADGAVLIFKSREAAHRFAEKDPYVLNGLIVSSEVREWTVVIGGEK